MDKYKNKYRIASTRLQHWDYGWAAAYFITICTKNRKHFFGNISDHVLQLSPVGAIADVLWHEIKNHAKNVTLGEFVVMPNHIHGILILNNDSNNTNDTNITKTIGQQRFQNQGKNTVSSIIGSYKSAVTRHVRRLGFEFAWQSKFWDHIIRNNNEHQRISQYIINNPQKWDNDKLNGGKGNVVLEPLPGYNLEDWMI